MHTPRKRPTTLSNQPTADQIYKSKLEIAQALDIPIEAVTLDENFSMASATIWRCRATAGDFTFQFTCYAHSNRVSIEVGLAPSHRPLTQCDPISAPSVKEALKRRGWGLPTTSNPGPDQDCQAMLHSLMQTLENGRWHLNGEVETSLTMLYGTHKLVPVVSPDGSPPVRFYRMKFGDSFTLTFLVEYFNYNNNWVRSWSVQTLIHAESEAPLFDCTYTGCCKSLLPDVKLMVYRIGKRPDLGAKSREIIDQILWELEGVVRPKVLAEVLGGTF